MRGTKSEHGLDSDQGLVPSARPAGRREGNVSRMFLLTGDCSPYQDADSSPMEFLSKMCSA